MLKSERECCDSSASGMKQRKRVLYLSPVLPLNAYSGFQYRAIETLRYLAQRYEVDLLTCGPNAPSPEPCTFDLQLLRRWKVVPEPGRSTLGELARLCHADPVHVQIYSQPETIDTVKQWVSESRYDAIFMNRTFQYRAIDAIPPSMRPPVIVDQHAAETDVWENLVRNHPKTLFRLYARLNAPKVARFERRVYRELRGAISITERDRAITERLHPATALVMIPQGIDTTEYLPCNDPEYDYRTLLFSGTAATRNVDAMRWFAEQVFPRVRAAIPEAKVLWIGNVTYEHVPFLAGDSAYKLTGFVDKTPPYFNKGLVFIAPFRMGEGMKTKIVEALAMGRMVVSTSMGVQGVETDGLPYVRIEDDPVRFADAIIEFLEKREWAEAQAGKARAFAVDKYAWEKILTRMDVLFENKAAQKDAAERASLEFGAESESK